MHEHNKMWHPLFIPKCPVHFGNSSPASLSDPYLYSIVHLLKNTKKLSPRQLAKAFAKHFIEVSKPNTSFASPFIQTFCKHNWFEWIVRGKVSQLQGVYGFQVVAKIFFHLPLLAQMLIIEECMASVKYKVVNKKQMKQEPKSVIWGYQVRATAPDLFLGGPLHELFSNLPGTSQDQNSKVEEGWREKKRK